MIMINVQQVIMIYQLCTINQLQTNIM